MKKKAKMLVNSIVSDSLRPYEPYSFPGSSVHGIFQGSHSLLQGIFPTQDQTWVSCIEGGSFTTWAIREARTSAKKNK